MGKKSKPPDLPELPGFGMLGLGAVKGMMDINIMAALEETLSDIIHNHDDPEIQAQVKKLYDLALDFQKTLEQDLPDDVAQELAMTFANKIFSKIMGPKDVKSML